MVALSDRYESATGWIYTIGGLSLVVGSVLLGVALWRTRTLPRWAAVALPASIVLNIVGFSVASQPVLVLSYVVALTAFAPAAVETVRPEPRTAERSAVHAPAGEFAG